MKLRPYQAEAIGAVRDAYRGGASSALLVMCTGAGKTFTALNIVTRVAMAGHRVLWLAHRKELLEQPKATVDAVPEWADLGPRCGIVQGQRNECDRDIVFASVSTVGRPDGARIQDYLSHGAPYLVVVDEAHRSTSATWTRTIEAVREAADAADPMLLGLTATPERTDKQDLSVLWGDSPVYSYAIQDAIADGYLHEPTFIVEQLDGDAFASLASNATDEEIGKALMAAGIVEHTVEQMGRHLRGRATLVFTANVSQARATADALEEAGWRAAVVSGETPEGQRAQIVRMFKRGDIDVICNCAVFTEGTDIPRCDAIVAARPFSSKPLWIQSVGRCLRLYPGKTDALVLDLAAASVEHGILHAAGLLSSEEGEGEGASQATSYEALKMLNIGGKWVSAGDKVMGRPGERKGTVIPEKAPDRVLVLGTDVKGSSRNIYAGMVKRRAPVQAAWARMPGLDRRTFGVDVGEHGYIYVIEEGDDLWQTYHVKKKGRKATALARMPTTLGLAQGLGDDLFRQAQGLVRAQAAWRDREASDKQVQYAERLGIAVQPGMTAGEVGALITVTKGRQRVLRLGLAGAL